MRGGESVCEKMRKKCFEFLSNERNMSTSFGLIIEIVLSKEFDQMHLLILKEKEKKKKEKGGEEKLDERPSASFL